MKDGSDDKPPNRAEHVPVISAIAAMSKMPEHERERTLDRMGSMRKPLPYNCEACEDAGVIVHFDDEGVAHGRVCSCLQMRAADKRADAEREMAYDFAPSRENDEDEDTAFDFSRGAA